MRRYDMLAISLLCFSSIVVIAITLDPNGFSLRDWQPLMAACVALTAANLAYKSAMAKVDFDRDLAAKTIAQKRIGIQLRLRFALSALVNEATAARGTLESPPIGFRPPPESIRLKSRPEIDEAWLNLDLLPLEIAFAIDTLRTEVPEAQASLKRSCPDRQPIHIPPHGVRFNHPLADYLSYVERFETLGTYVVEMLNREIDTARLK